MKFGFTDFVRSQWKTLPPNPNVDLTGQTVLVTGSNTGLGLEAAKQLARMNPAHLVLAVRNLSKGEEALSELQKETNYAGGKVMKLDHGDFASVSAFVTEFEKVHDRLDVFVANAGISTTNYTATKDGWESTIQVNHLSTSLLTLLLLPTFVRTAEKYGGYPNITIVASDVHYWAKPLPKEKILSTLSDPKFCTFSVMSDRYNVSKLFNVFFTRSLGSHLPPTSPLIVNCVTPGLTYSSLMRDAPLLLRPLVKLFLFTFARKTADGAKTYIWAALAGKQKDQNSLRENLRGAFTMDCEITEPSDYSLSRDGREAEEKLWDETLEVIRKVDPRVQGIVTEFLKA